MAISSMWPAGETGNTKAGFWLAAKARGQLIWLAVAINAAAIGNGVSWRENHFWLKVTGCRRLNINAMSPG